jgi:ketosteroid isomerase-like protein
VGISLGAPDFAPADPKRSGWLSARILDSNSDLAKDVVQVEADANTPSFMKFRLSLLVLAFCALGIAVAQERSDSSKILTLEKDWNTAYKGGDVARMNTLLADDFIITIEDGRTFSKSGYIAFNGNSTVRVDVSEMSDLKIRVHGNSAVVTGAYHEKGTAQGKPYEYQDRFTDVWTKIAGQWQLLASQYSIPAKQ